MITKRSTQNLYFCICKKRSRNEKGALERKKSRNKYRFVPELISWIASFRVDQSQRNLGVGNGLLDLIASELGAFQVLKTFLLLGELSSKTIIAMDSFYYNLIKKNVHSVPELILNGLRNIEKLIRVLRIEKLD